MTIRVVARGLAIQYLRVWERPDGDLLVWRRIVTVRDGTSYCGNEMCSPLKLVSKDERKIAERLPKVST